MSDADIDRATEEADNEKFGDELVDLIRRVAREEVSFALRPGVRRDSDQLEIKPEDEEVFPEDIFDLTTRIATQEWQSSVVLPKAGPALSLVTEQDCEDFGWELVDVVRRAARDTISFLMSCQYTPEVTPTVANEVTPTGANACELPEFISVGLSGPKISKAVPQVAFRVGPYEAALFSDIEAPGMIQYEHILVIYDNQRSPRLFVCAEWSRLQPAAEQRLYFLGLFENGSHVNLGHDEDIADRSVFALRAIEAARKRLSLPTPSALSEGEAIAITEILKDLQTKGGASEACRARYGRVLKKYDAAIVEFLKTLRDPGQAITARTTPHPNRADIDLAPGHRGMPDAKAASGQNHVTPRDLLPAGMVMPDTPSGEFDFMKEWQRAALAEAKEIGANDPCSCRSGKKFKDCHGRLESTSPAVNNNGSSLTPHELATPGGGQAVPSGQARGRPFGPKITKATSVLTFKIGTRDAILLDYIEAPGVIQYKYILAVKDETETPDLFVCCEWSHLSSSPGERQLFLGVFKDRAHVNLGINNQLSNRLIFLLRAVEVAKKQLGVPDDMPLTDGEAYAIKEMLKASNHGVNQDAFLKILSRYDGKIVEYMKQGLSE